MIGRYSGVDNSRSRTKAGCFSQFGRIVRNWFNPTSLMTLIDDTQFYGQNGEIARIKEFKSEGGEHIYALLFGTPTGGYCNFLTSGEQISRLAKYVRALAGREYIRSEHESARETLSDFRILTCNKRRLAARFITYVASKGHIAVTVEPYAGEAYVVSLSAESWEFLVRYMTSHWTDFSSGE